MRAVIGILVAIVVSLPAAAAPPTPTPQQLDAAKTHFERAQALHAKGNYDEAIAEYRAAFDAAPLPALLFNIGQSYRLKGDKRQAVDYYKRYLQAAPGGPGAVEAQSHIAVLGREIDAEDTAAREKAAAAERARAAEERAKAVEEARRKEREAARAELVAAPPEQAAPGRTLKIAGLATAAGGVVLAGVGMYFGLRAKSLSDDLAKLGSGDEWDPSVRSDGQAAQRNMIIFTAVGAAAAVTGGVLYFLGARADTPAETVLAPALAPGVVGVVGVGRF
jgi:tetratricopeptide (TPR) repeat protein